jgi:SET domain-containing protein
MKKRLCIFVVFFSVIFVWSGLAPLSAETPSGETPILKINKEYDKRTVIKNSTIPNAGNGLFAVLKIKKGEVIGELGGRLVTDSDYAQGNHYIAAIPECAWKETLPYKHIDSKDYGANVSRINFAPSKINGIETHFQNAAIKQLCHPPYFIFVALKNIKPGAEIWSSYGPHYDYDTFMIIPEVRDFFCGLLKIDCRKTFAYSH